jgi:NitT/TauT family transport system substrate-binding protein
MVLTILTGCSSKEIQNEETTKEAMEIEEAVENVTVKVGALKGPTSIGMIKMIDETPVFDENVDVEYEIMPAPDLLIAKLLTGEIDIATIPTNAAAKVYNKGIDYKLAATSIWGVMYGVGTDESIKGTADLKGKKISSIGMGVTPDVIMRYLLQENGINPEEDLTIQYGFPPVELAHAMVSGKVELAILPEPFVTMVTMQNKDMKVLFDIQEEFNNLVDNGDNALAQTCVVVKGDLLESNPEFVDAFLKSYAESVAWVNEKPVDAGVLVEKHGILPKAKIAELAIPRLNMKFVSATESKKSVEAYLKVLYDFSPADIGGQMPDESFYMVQ